MKFRINPDLSIRKIDNEVFIYDRDKAFVHMFNETGALFWDALQKGMSPETIINELVETYEIGYDEAETDLNEFMDKLKSLNVLISE
jgi:hypothetical protein